MDRSIVFNPNFNLGIRGWHSNSCTAYVLPSKNRESGSIIDGQFVCLITKRKQTWNGLEQDLTPQLQLNVTYGVTVIVMLPNASGTPIDIKATLRLENPNAPTKYLSIGMYVLFFSDLCLQSKLNLDYMCWFSYLMQINSKWREEILI